MKLVIYPAIDAPRLSAVASVVPSMQIVNASDEATATAETRDADAFFGKITRDILASAERLRWVQSPTASLEHYIFEELAAHACVLTNMRGIFSDVIADQVLGYVLCFARNLHVYIRQQAKAQWAPVGGEHWRPSFAAGPGIQSPIDRAHLHLADCTLGIVGFGQIGREVARRALAFGMRVVAVDPVTDHPLEGVASLKRMDHLDHLLSESDFVVIAAPHTPETAGLFGRDRLARMKSTAYLINIGRGVIVKLDDLADALEASLLAGAALDVYEIEPLPPTHRLWSMENVLLTPHVAGHSPRIAERHLSVLVENVQRFAAHQPLLNVVDKRAWY